MPTTPSQPPRGRPGPGPGDGRRACRRMPGPPLPDPDAVRLCPIPDSLPRPTTTNCYRPPPGEPPRPASRPGRAPSPPQAGGRDQPGERLPAGHRDQPGDEPTPLPPQAGFRRGTAAGQASFAQVLVETLAGSRPPRQMTTWTTERTRARIQRLGPMLAAGQRPQLRRGGGIPARVRGDRDDRGGQLRVPGPGPGRAARTHPAAPCPARSTSPADPAGCAPTWKPPRRAWEQAMRWAGPAHGRAGQPLSPRRGCGGRRDSACTCGLTRRGTGRCGRPG